MRKRLTAIGGLGLALSMTIASSANVTRMSVAKGEPQLGDDRGKHDAKGEPQPGDDRGKHNA